MPTDEEDDDDDDDTDPEVPDPSIPNTDLLPDLKDPRVMLRLMKDPKHRWSLLNLFDKAKEKWE